MLLAIDIGNTNTVFAVYKNDKLVDFWRFQTIAARAADEYAAFLSQMFNLAGLQWKDIQDIIICSVVPDADFPVVKFCKKYLKHEPVFITAKNVGIKAEIDRPEELGADRIVNAAAMRAHYKKAPAIVIDFGTATTFDVINKKGNYAGGVIAPGINLSIEALSRAAAKLPKVGVKKPKKVIGTSTVGAIESGIYWGYIGLIEGTVERISKEMKAKPFVLATGGLAPLFANDTKTIQAVDETLTLKGILCVYHTLQKRK